VSRAQSLLPGCPISPISRKPSWVPLVLSSFVSGHDFSRAVKPADDAGFRACVRTRSLGSHPGRTADPSASLGMTNLDLTLSLGFVIRMERLRSTEAAQRTLPSQSPPSMEALPSPLSSRAKPRDLQCAPDGSQGFGFSRTLFSPCGKPLPGGYGLPRRSEHQAVRECFAMNSALVAEGRLPLPCRGKQHFFLTLFSPCRSSVPVRKVN
jgi:hypothetical protein